MADFYATLKTELTTDPLGRGYSGMTDQQAADSLNTVNRTIVRTEIPTYLFLDGMVYAEWLALSADQKAYLSLLFAQPTISVAAAGQTRAALLGIFAAGTTTRANLAPLQTYAASRATELGLPVVYPGNVASARAI